MRRKTLYKDTNEKTSLMEETEEEFFDRIAEQTGEYYVKFS